MWRETFLSLPTLHRIDDRSMATMQSIMQAIEAMLPYYTCTCTCIWNHGCTLAGKYVVAGVYKGKERTTYMYIECSGNIEKYGKINKISINAKQYIH